jgi:hypothetical protein
MWTRPPSPEPLRQTPLVGDRWERASAASELWGVDYVLWAEGRVQSRPSAIRNHAAGRSLPCSRTLSQRGGSEVLQRPATDADEVVAQQAREALGEVAAHAGYRTIEWALKELSETRFAGYTSPPDTRRARERGMTGRTAAIEAQIEAVEQQLGNGFHRHIARSLQDQSDLE